MPLGLRRFPINGNAQILANSVASMSVEMTASAKNECVPPWFALGENSLTLYLTFAMMLFVFIGLTPSYFVSDALPKRTILHSTKHQVSIHHLMAKHVD